MRSTATTVGALLSEIEWAFRVTIRPRAVVDGVEAKYFDVSPSPAPPPPRPASLLRRIFSPPPKLCACWVVEVHIRRGGATICPKQDLSFVLLEDDHVVFESVALFC